MKKKILVGLTTTLVFLGTAALSAGSLMENYKSYVDDFLHTKSSEVVTTDGEVYNKYTPDKKYLDKDGKGDSKAIIEEAIRLGTKLGAEGTVLLKNKNNTLPLKSKAKVTLLGARSSTPLVGAGMGVKAEGAMITLQDAFESTTTKFNQEDHIATYLNRSPWTYGAGKTIKSGYEKFDNFAITPVGFSVNPVMDPLYKQYNNSLPEGRALTNNDSMPDPTTTKYSPEEPSIAELEALNPNFKDSFNEYNDAAIVVIGRPSNESYDYWKGSVADGLGVTEPLQITTNEKDIINLACEKFSNVVVIVNSANPMDLGDLQNNPKIGAILDIGHPGVYGLMGVAQVLAGQANPSGKLVDTFAANQLSAPAMMNMGDYTFSNSSEVYRQSYMGEADTSTKYVIEAEGIYTGYKYYETRYADTVLNQGNAKSSKGTYASTGAWDYDKEVVYPFGYGQSYSTFSQEFVGEPEFTQTAHSITASIKVKVTNKEGIKGKDVVEVYGQAPYIDGGLEKSAIQLLGYAKTNELAEGESQTVTVDIDLQNLASYDNKHVNANGTKGTYVLDAGDYYFSLGNGAHDALVNVLTAQNKLETGDKNKVFKKTYAYDDTTFSVSRNDEYISNQLDYADWNYYDNETEVKYLSRHDWDATYPVEYKNMKASSKLLLDLNAQGDEYYRVTPSDTKDVVWGKSTDLRLADMFKADWDDSRWDELVDAMTLEEAVKMFMYGGPNLAGAESIGWPTDKYLTENSGSGITVAIGSSKDGNAPWTISAEDNNAAWKGSVFANATTTASTWSPELTNEIGEFIGTEALFTGIPFLWGPGLNTHRHAYNGRTGEYYSEDAILAGNTAMEFSIGAFKNGLIASPKHFAFNDQETNRYGVAPFMTEQRARETELRAYQIAIEANKYDTEDSDVGMRGMMTSFSKIGGVECCCSYGLMTNIVQKEWGFHGYAVTDIYDDTDIFSAVAHAGTTCIDLRGFSSSMGLNPEPYAAPTTNYEHSLERYATDGNFQKSLKNAARNMLWVTAQSNFMNTFNKNSHTEWRMTSWRAAYIFGSIALFIGAAVCVVFIVLNQKKEGAN